MTVTLYEASAEFARDVISQIHAEPDLTLIDREGVPFVDDLAERETIAETHVDVEAAFEALISATEWTPWDLPTYEACQEFETDMYLARMLADPRYKHAAPGDAIELYQPPVYDLPAHAVEVTGEIVLADIAEAADYVPPDNGFVRDLDEGFERLTHEWDASGRTEGWAVPAPRRPFRERFRSMFGWIAAGPMPVMACNHPAPWSLSDDFSIWSCVACGQPMGADSAGL